MAKIDAFSAISDQNRRILLEALRREPHTVNALADLIPAISRPAISQHLKILLETALVSVQAQGTKRIYTINKSGFDGVNMWLDQFWTQG